MSSSISVAVRVRPFSDKERALDAGSTSPGPSLSNPGSTSVPGLSQAQRLGVPSQHRKILKVLDERILVFDPPDSNAVATFQKTNLPLQGKKVKDIRFCFDRVFDDDCGQEEVYEGSAKELVGHVMDGFHSTVFAYGATGCGKTHTISGSPTQPGIVFLIMKDLFSRISAKSDEVDFTMTVSYLEVYNETIRDLLAPESGILQLRDAPDGTATPAKLSTQSPKCAQDVVEWITLGNGNRTVNFTEANATSSRSHAVLRVTVTQKPKAEGLVDSTTSATLSVIDLAGSERASNTKNRGERLTEGANINRSLLALGNCINALCDSRGRGHIPYRDSKLTRLLKQSLGGNCKTVMIVCVSPSSFHYDETHNTLQYANRAKEIKTKAIRNVISVDRHVAQYCQQIMRQTQEIERLRTQLTAQQASSALRDQADDERIVQQTVTRIFSEWEAGKIQKMAAVSATSEKVVTGNLLQILQQWQSTVFGGLSSDNSPSPSSVSAASTTSLLQFETQETIKELTSRNETLRTLAAREASSMEPFTRLLSTTQATLRSQHPSAAPLFAYEVKLLDARLRSFCAEAREEGARRGVNTQVHTVKRMFEAGVKVGTALSSARQNDSEAAQAHARLAQKIEHANSVAFARFSSEPGSIPSQSNDFAHGVKRDLGTRSPQVSENAWNKVARLASPTRQLPPSQTQTSFRVARNATQSPKKAKGVQWRDETGDGLDLEDVKFNTPDSSSTSFPSLTVTSPTSQMWTSSSSCAPSSNAALAAEMMASRTRAFTASSALTPHRPPPVSDPSIPFSFLPLTAPSDSVPSPRSSTTAPRSPFHDLANTSLAAASEVSTHKAPPSPSLFAPLVASEPPRSLDLPMASLDAPHSRQPRRVSSIGPLRTAKTRHRTSSIAPSSSSANDLSFTSGGPVSRKAGRIVSGPAALPSSSSASTAVRPLPPSKSSNFIGGGVASRRLSTHPTQAPTASGSGTPATTQPAGTFGQKSLARIAARRASKEAANTSGSNLTVGGRSIANALGSKKDSPSTSAPPVWR
ncbi:hypothetical protein JCM16303_001913 [Sporobolomyces ruberrimus]